VQGNCRLCSCPISKPPVARPKPSEVSIHLLLELGAFCVEATSEPPAVGLLTLCLRLQRRRCTLIWRPENNRFQSAGPGCGLQRGSYRSLSSAPTGLPGCSDSKQRTTRRGADSQCYTFTGLTEKRNRKSKQSLGSLAALHSKDTDSLYFQVGTATSHGPEFESCQRKNLHSSISSMGTWGKAAGA
jgi:hypothetical protein